MKYSGHRKLLCKLSLLNAFMFLGYQKNTDASIFVYKHSPERTGFNLYAVNTQLQLTFLTLLHCLPPTRPSPIISIHFRCPPTHLKDFIPPAPPLHTFPFCPRTWQGQCLVPADVIENQWFSSVQGFLETILNSNIQLQTFTIIYCFVSVQ